MNSKILYVGLFVKDVEGLLKLFPAKYEKVFAHHCTLEYRAKAFDAALMGKSFKLKVLAEVLDDKCQALMVETNMSKNKYPHITISCTSETQPKYSNDLILKKVESGEVKYLNEEIFIEVVYGYCDFDRNIHLIK